MYILKSTVLEKKFENTTIANEMWPTKPVVAFETKTIHEIKRSFRTLEL